MVWLVVESYVEREDLEVLPLEERLSMWPSDAMMSKAISDNREIPEYFKEGGLCWIVG